MPSNSSHDHGHFLLPFLKLHPLFAETHTHTHAPSFPNESFGPPSYSVPPCFCPFTRPFSLCQSLITATQTLLSSVCSMHTFPSSLLAFHSLSSSSLFSFHGERNSCKGAGGETAGLLISFLASPDEPPVIVTGLS